MRPRERLEKRECDIKEGWNKRGRIKRERGKRPIKRDRESVRKREWKGQSSEMSKSTGMAERIVSERHLRREKVECE